MKQEQVRLLPSADEHLQRLLEHILEREVTSPTGDSQVALAAVEIRVALKSLAFTPFTCRKAGDDPFWRELVIPFGCSGYVALFLIRENEVLVAKIRHQRQADFLSSPARGNLR